MKRIIGIILAIITILGFFGAIAYSIGFMHTLGFIGFIIIITAWVLLVRWLFE